MLDIFCDSTHCTGCVAFRNVSLCPGGLCISVMTWAAQDVRAQDTASRSTMQLCDPCHTLTEPMCFWLWEGFLLAPCVMWRGLKKWKQHACPFTSPCCTGREIIARSFTARPAMKPAVCSPERFLSMNGCGASHTYKLTTAYFSTERPKLDKRFCPDFTKHHHSANLFNESTSFWIIHSYKELFFFLS